MPSDSKFTYKPMIPITMNMTNKTAIAAVAAINVPQSISKKKLLLINFELRHFTGDLVVLNLKLPTALCINYVLAHKI